MIKLELNGEGELAAKATFKLASPNPIRKTEIERFTINQIENISIPIFTRFDKIDFFFFVNLIIIEGINNIISRR